MGKNQQKFKNYLTICPFLDLSKAFDTVNHGILLEKLQPYGCRGFILQLPASLWQDRKQFVQIDEKVSDVRDMNVGIPQGSVMGPLFFLVYINYITNKQGGISQIALSADDCSILTSQQHNPFPAHEKQLHQISTWLSANKLTLELEKTFCIKFSRKKSMRNTLRKNEKHLETKTNIKCLVIFIDSDLNFKNHVSYVCKGICELVAFLHHCKNTSTRDLKLHFYDYSIKSITEFGFSV